MKTFFDCIVEPLRTEKGSLQEADRKYYFKVAFTATKKEIRSAIEKVFNVHVIKINTQCVKGKLKRVRFQPGYTSDWKKAIVTLKKGEKLDLA
ncbi:MAG: 50S ribosomal protein L23 [Candidatus Omnitrophica bacterium]|nr:50S ribosomal protein L23 [Candidatus Omnitrophota bacterium]